MPPFTLGSVTDPDPDLVDEISIQLELWKIENQFGPNAKSKQQEIVTD